MPRLALEIAHSLGSEEAAKRLKDKLTSALAEHGEHMSDFREEWLDHTLSFAFKAMGMAVSGRVAVEPARVDMSVELPFAAMFFKGAIEDRLRQEVGHLLAS